MRRFSDNFSTTKNLGWTIAPYSFFLLSTTWRRHGSRRCFKLLIHLLLAFLAIKTIKRNLAISFTELQPFFGQLESVVNVALLRNTRQTITFTLTNI